MSEPTCSFCGAPNPRWLRHIDRSPQDAVHRQLYGMPGPTSEALRACDRDECRRKLDREPSGIRHVAHEMLARIEVELMREWLPSSVAQERASDEPDVWRLIGDTPRGPSPQSIARLQALQRRFGEENVTTGNPSTAGTCLAADQEHGVGLYVRVAVLAEAS